jgi:hypothetical protein
MPADALAVGTIAGNILEMRGTRVLLDRDLARLYGVRPTALRQQVRRNLDRFPADFMFVLTRAEAGALVSQSVIPSFKELGGSMPYAFTEQGVAMLSSVLGSERAIAVNIAIMRAFVRTRALVASSRALAEKLAELERKVGGHDAAINALFEAIRDLAGTPKKRRRPIGFTADIESASDD